MNRLIFILFNAYLLSGSALGQSPDSLMSAYNNKFPQEKIHIHFDKDTYLPGETVWMKAYLMNGDRPSAISKNIYFDWTDADGHLLLHAIAPITEGGASGFFQIPVWVKNGVVHVKAYTQWMLNFDNAFLFNKNIPVLMPADDGYPTPAKQQVSVSFFPEGGDLVNGVSSVLAFEALDQHNRPVLMSGAVKNAKNAIVDSFHTTSNGMGTLRFKPSIKDHYTAYWTDETGQLHSVRIRDVEPNGLILHVEPYNNDQLHYRLEKSTDASNLKRVVVIGTMNQKVVYKNSLTLTYNMGEGNVAGESLPCGVIQLTVFDENMQPLAERVAFINNQKAYAKIMMRKEMVGLNKRARNEISIEIPDTLVTNLSVSVTDAGLGYDSSNNIYSDLLLSEDIKGSIPDPASFLTNPQNANENLNLLMLTHGWRRFSWEAVVSGKYPEVKHARDQGYLSIKGEIKFSTDLDDRDSVSMLLISRDRKKHVLKLPVDRYGKFEQNGLFFYDSVQIVYKFNDIPKLNSNGQIFLNSDLLPALTPAKADEPSFSWIKVPDVILEKDLNGSLIESRDYTIPSNSMTYVMSPKVDSLGRNSESAAHYLADNFTDLHFPVTLKGKTSAGDAKLVSYKPVFASQAHNNVNVTVDGTPVAMDDLKTMNMKEVLFIKFLPRAGSSNLPTLAITSRQALAQADILENKTGFAVVTGYTPVREFYQPHYDNKMEDFQVSDYRSTLYWNPKLRLDKTHHKTNFVFYNNDISNKFRVVIEGMNQNGKICRVEEIIK